MKKQTEVQAGKFQCPFCKKYFTERTLISHKCKLKDRHFQRGTKAFTLGLFAWEQFCKVNCLWRNNVDIVDRFMNSSEYSTFYDLGTHILNTNIFDVEHFIMYLMKNSIPARAWKSDITLQNWVFDYTRNENLRSAITRGITTIQLWAEELGCDWTTFFESVSSTRAILLIENGQVSPWLLYGASTTHKLYDRLSDHEFQHVYQYINPQIWGVKKIKYKEDFTDVVKLLKEFNL
jgi:hypothetical protein